MVPKDRRSVHEKGRLASPIFRLKRSRELETYKAKTGEEAQFTEVNEHSEPVFNAVGPTRSRS
ncbi:hypothetical protein EQ832_24750 [Pseudomonas sp. ALS1131]|nr:hypothetical protein EQ832_24750 [Pseudomonas sp. ALS1131]